MTTSSRPVINTHYMRGCCTPKQHFTAMTSDSKLHNIVCVISIKLNISQKITGFVLWHVISMKLNIGQKITRLEIITFTCKKNLACFQTGKTDVRAYSSSLLHTIIAGNHLPFLKMYSNFSHFCTNFQIFCLFFQHIFAIFLKNCIHTLTF